MAFGLYSNGKVATVVGSTWLSWWYGWQSTGWHELMSAAKEALFETFWSGAARYNSNLWTMRYEFIGSFIALGCAGAALILKDNRRVFVWLASAWAVATVWNPYLGCFVVGVALAWAHRHMSGVTLRSPLWLAVGLPLALILAGYHQPVWSSSANPTGFYAFMKPVALLAPHLTPVLFYTGASLIVLTLALYSGPVIRCLTRRPMVVLGVLSFPLYLVHIVVICSVGSWVFLLILPASSTLASVSAIGTSIFLSFIVAWPLAALDQSWLAMLRRVSKSENSFSARTSSSAVSPSGGHPQ
jgi:peptidoglycan/LPS O-acetylase OafA/YrhL